MRRRWEEVLRTVTNKDAVEPGPHPRTVRMETNVEDYQLIRGVDPTSPVSSGVKATSGLQYGDYGLLSLMVVV